MASKVKSKNLNPQCVFHLIFNNCIFVYLIDNRFDKNQRKTSFFPLIVFEMSDIYAVVNNGKTKKNGGPLAGNSCYILK